MARTPLTLVVLILAACGGSATTTTTTTTAATTPTSAETTITSAPTTMTSVAVVGVDELALPVAGDEMGPGWVEELFIAYGDSEELLGTSPGGDAGTLDLGPDYGAQAPDGTWWFLDAAKTRLARYDAAGTYLGAVALPVEVLVDGEYFQFQMPRVMADGTLVAFGSRADGGSAVLRASASGVVDQIMLAGLVLPRVDDGFLAYGFDETGALVGVDPSTGSIVPSEWFMTQAGTRFYMEMTAEGFRIVLPDAPTPIDRVLPLVTTGELAVPAYGGIEATTTTDGRIHVLVLGASSSDEATQLGGYFTILPDGTVTPVVAVRNPFSLADSGSPSHLGAAFGFTEPWFMVVDADGIHVYRRTA